MEVQNESLAQVTQDGAGNLVSCGLLVSRQAAMLTRGLPGTYVENSTPKNAAEPRDRRPRAPEGIRGRASAEHGPTSKLGNDYQY